jgi:hypothetical protein
VTVIVRGGTPRLSRDERERLVRGDLERFPGDDDGTRAERLASNLALSPVTAYKVVRRVKTRLGLIQPVTRKRSSAEHRATSRAGQLMALSGWHPYRWRSCCWTGQPMTLGDEE